MKRKEKTIQKALGTLQPYTIYCTIELPYQTTISVPCTMDIKAASEEEAQEEAKAFFKKMSCAERKAWAWADDNVDCERFDEENEPEMSILYENAQAVASRVYKEDTLNIVNIEEAEEE